MGFIKYANDMEKMDGIVHGDFHKLRREDMKRKAAKEAAEEATKETQEETLLQNLRSLMETLHFSAEQAMAALKVPESRRAQLAAKL